VSRVVGLPLLRCPVWGAMVLDDRGELTEEETPTPRVSGGFWFRETGVGDGHGRSVAGRVETHLDETRSWW